MSSPTYIFPLQHKLPRHKLMTTTSSRHVQMVIHGKKKLRSNVGRVLRHDGATQINHIRYSHELPVTYLCQPRLNQTFIIIIIIIALVIIKLSSPKGNDSSFFSQTNTHQLTPLYPYLAM